MMNKIMKIDQRENFKLSRRLVMARYNLTLREQRIIIALCSQIREDQTEFTTVRVKAADLAKFCHIDSHDKYKIIRETLIKLMEHTLQIQGDNGEWYATHWLQSARYIGNGILEYRFDDNLKPELLEIKTEYINTPAAPLLEFKREYTARMYFILKQHNRQKKFKITLEEIRESFRLGETYKIISNIKNQVLEPALKEINEKSDIEVSYEYYKKGRVIEGIEFEVRKKKKIKEIENLTAKEYNRVTNFLKTMEITLPRTTEPKLIPQETSQKEKPEEAAKKKENEERVEKEVKEEMTKEFILIDPPTEKDLETIAKEKRAKREAKKREAEAAREKETNEATENEENKNVSAEAFAKIAEVVDVVKVNEKLKFAKVRKAEKKSKQGGAGTKGTPAKKPGAAQGKESGSAKVAEIIDAVIVNKAAQFDEITGIIDAVIDGTGKTDGKAREEEASQVRVETFDGKADGEEEKDYIEVDDVTKSIMDTEAAREEKFSDDNEDIIEAELVESEAKSPSTSENSKQVEKRAEMGLGEAKKFGTIKNTSAIENTLKRAKATVKTGQSSTSTVEQIKTPDQASEKSASTTSATATAITPKSSQTQPTHRPERKTEQAQSVAGETRSTDNALLETLGNDPWNLSEEIAKKLIGRYGEKAVQACMKQAMSKTETEYTPGKQLIHLLIRSVLQ